MTDLPCGFCRHWHHGFCQDEDRVFTCAQCGQERAAPCHDGEACEPRRFESLTMSVPVGNYGLLGRTCLKTCPTGFVLEMDEHDPPHPGGLVVLHSDEQFALYMSRGDLKLLRDLFDRALKETPE